MTRSPLIYACGLLVLAMAGSMHAAERVALVIGNNAYRNGPALKNCVNDARAVAEGLKGCGFEVTLVEDAGLQALEQKLREFKTAATGAKAAWFYYAGHGVEVGGSNYLLPVDAAIEQEFEVKHRTLPLDMVLGAMDGAGTPLKVVVLDCCRDNPFGRGWSRSGSSGLAQVASTPKGTIIAYATAPGMVAADGEGKNSPFAAALVQALGKPGLEVDGVFRETGRAVKMATGDKQHPWLNMSFYDSFVMRPGDPGAVPPVAPAPVVPPLTPAMLAGIWRGDASGEGGAAASVVLRYRDDGQLRMSTTSGGSQDQKVINLKGKWALKDAKLNIEVTASNDRKRASGKKLEWLVLSSAANELTIQDDTGAKVVFRRMEGDALKLQEDIYRLEEEKERREQEIARLEETKREPAPTPESKPKPKPATKPATAQDTTPKPKPTPAPESKPKPKPAPAPASQIPVATAVPGKPGFVHSPYNNRIIDVRGQSSGTVIHDPTYPKGANKQFRLP